MRDTIDMAREAGFTWEPINNIIGPLERFADLVRADERALAFVKLEQRVKEAYQDGHTAGAKSEREACAKVCEQYKGYGGNLFAPAIRARGQA